MAPSRIEPILRDSVERGARCLALNLLAHVRETRDRLDDLGDKDALHDFRVALRRLRSWLRAFRPAFADTITPKTERRLKRIAKATGSSRDLEVHVKWVEEARRSLSDNARVGANWLLHRLRRDKREADADFRSVIDRKFGRAAEDTEAALSRYQASLHDDGERFAAAAADILEIHVVALSNAVARVTGHGDRAEAHAARIAAKRLRYLLEGVAEASPAATPLIEELKALQDTLGELHDSQLFASELARMIAELIADNHNVRDAKGSRSASRVGPVPGLRVLSRRMRRAEEASFQTYAAAWTPETTDAFSARVSALAGDLRDAGRAEETGTPATRRARAVAST